MNSSYSEHFLTIPEDFDYQWGVSDVVLRMKTLKNPSNPPLHVSKAVLATYSSYFKSMFYSGFSEATKEEVELNGDYEAMKEILRIIHGIPRNSSEYSCELLASLYILADEFNFPMVRDVWNKELGKRDEAEALRVVIRAGPLGMKLHLLQRMRDDQFKSFFRHEKGEDPVFSVIEVFEIMKPLLFPSAVHPRNL